MTRSFSGDTKLVTRRTVARSAAWSIPVIAAAVAAPSASASVAPEQQNVTITADCYGLSILGVGASFPQFTITAVGAPILAGSTFLLQGDGLANLTIGNTNGAGLLNVISGSAAVFTLSKDIPAGAAVTLKVTGLVSAQVAKTYSFSVQNVLGNANSNPADDSGSSRLTGLSVLGVLVGRCTRS